MRPRSGNKKATERYIVSKDASNSHEIGPKKGNIWHTPTLRHLVAWVILIAVGITVWKMVIPVRHASNGKPGDLATTTTAVSGINRAGLKKEELIITTTTQVAQQKPVLIRAVILVRALNLRLEPDAKSKVIGRLIKGTVVQVLEKNGAWLKIKTDKGLTGYISSKSNLVKINK